MVLPVLWLYGPAGVGKTTVAWELSGRLSRAGTPTGYVDIDQLGMCYGPPTPDNWAPEPASDPGRHRTKTSNLDAVVANFHRAGVRCVVVSGVVDTARGVDPAPVPHAALTRCRSRADPAELRRRIAGRGRPTDQLAQILRDAEALDANLPAGPAQLPERILLRGKGIGPAWGLAGDEMLGQPEAVLRQVAGRAAAQAEALDAAGIGDLRVDTDDRSETDIADEVLRRTGLNLRVP